MKIAEKEIVIIGYSGHSFLCIETAIMSGFKLLGYYDLVEKRNNPYNLKYLGFESSIRDHAPFITIGDNRIRKNIYHKIKDKNINLQTNIIHPSSIISASVSIENQIFISAGAIVNPRSIIKSGAIINTSCTIEHECVIGNFTHLAPGSTLCGNVNVGANSFIGANAIIKENVRIGENVIIGAGSVVLKDIPDNTVYVGNPVKKIR